MQGGRGYKKGKEDQKRRKRVGKDTRIERAAEVKRAGREEKDGKD